MGLNVSKEKISVYLSLLSQLTRILLIASFQGLRSYGRTDLYESIEMNLYLTYFLIDFLALVLSFSVGIQFYKGENADNVE